MEQFFAQNPAFAVWLVGLLIAALGWSSRSALRRVFERFDSQDKQLGSISNSVSGLMNRVRSLEMQVFGKYVKDEEER